MRFPVAPHSEQHAFTFIEVVVAVVMCIIFVGAVFATNQRLLVEMKNQKEQTAASMMLQERMEKFRATAYSDVADNDYVLNNILTFNPNPSPSPTPSCPPGGASTTWSEAALGDLHETVTVRGYKLAASPSPGPTPGGTPFYNQWIRDTTSGDHLPHEQTHYDYLDTMYDLLQVDILITWTSASGRQRTRELAAVFGKGNIGP